MFFSHSCQDQLSQTSLRRAYNALPLCPSTWGHKGVTWTGGGTGWELTRHPRKVLGKLEPKFWALGDKQQRGQFQKGVSPDTSLGVASRSFWLLMPLSQCWIPGVHHQAGLAWSSKTCQLLGVACTFCYPALETNPGFKFWLQYSLAKQLSEVAYLCWALSFFMCGKKKKTGPL